MFQHGSSSRSRSPDLETLPHIDLPHRHAQHDSDSDDDDRDRSERIQQQRGEDSDDDDLDRGERVQQQTVADYLRYIQYPRRDV